MSKLKPIPENIAERIALDDTPLRVEHPASAYDQDVPHYPPLRDPDEAWVEATLQEMTLEEKVGQLFVLTNHMDGEDIISRCHIGGFVFMGNNQKAEDIVASVNRLQRLSKYPLWFATDSEAGVGARVADATVFPLLMAFGAAGDPELTEQCGRITARESRALGLQATYGPVVDVNTQRLNPIISTRSYGASPQLVSKLGGAHAHGCCAEGVLATLKHYPGQGGAAGDSHHSLPIVDLSREEVEAQHVKPFRDITAAGNAPCIMTAHIWFSQVDTGDAWPATLSKTFGLEILRGKCGFDGVLIADAYDMVGLTIAVETPEERGVLGIEAGLDIILGPAPAEVEQTWQGIVDAVKSRRLPESRIDESVRRVLRAKSRAGLPENRFVDTEKWRKVLNHPAHREIVRRVCEKGFTEVRTNITGPPVGEGERIFIVSLNGAHKIFYRFPSSVFAARFLHERPDAEFRTVPHSLSEAGAAALIDDAQNFDKIIVLGFDWYRITSDSQVGLVNALCEETSVIYVGFGAPYHILQVPNVAAFYCGYASVAQMQEVAADVMLGKRKAEGKLPVPIPSSE